MRDFERAMKEEQEWAKKQAEEIKRQRRNARAAHSKYRTYQQTGGESEAESWMRREQERKERNRRSARRQQEFWNGLFETIFGEAKSPPKGKQYSIELPPQFVLQYDPSNDVVHVVPNDHSVATIFFSDDNVIYNFPANTLTLKMDYDTREHIIQDRRGTVLGKIVERDNLFSVLFRPWYSSYEISQQDGTKYFAARYSFLGGSSFTFYSKRFLAIAQAKVFPLDKTSYAFNVDRTKIGDPIFVIMPVAAYIKHKRRHVVVRFLDHFLAFFSVFFKTTKDATRKKKR